MKSNRSNAIAILLALTMTASALAGCAGTDDDVGDGPKELDDWGVYSVQSFQPAIALPMGGCTMYLQSQVSKRALVVCGRLSI